MISYLCALDSPQQKSTFEEIYHTYRKQMYYAAYQILQHPEDAEDAVHHAFVKIAENIEKFSDIQCPKTRSLCVTIVENKAIDIYRKRRRSIPFSALENVPEPAVQPHTGSLSACISRLPVNYRHVLILHHIHGYKYKEISRFLGITTANALKIDQRAKAALAKICEEEGVI